MNAPVGCDSCPGAGARARAGRPDRRERRLHGERVRRRHLPVPAASYGAFDAQFGTGGKLTAALGASGNDEALALAVQGDGATLVGGSTPAGLVLARFDAAGALDTSFASAGLWTRVSDYASFVGALAILPDERIVAAGALDAQTAVFRLWP